MALPPKGDPRRDLALAIRTGWVLSGLMILLFLLLTLGLGLAYMLSGGLPTYALILPITFISFVMLCFLIPTIFLTQRKKWAAIVLIVIASLGILGGFVDVIGGLASANVGSIIFGALIALAMAQFISYLSKAGKGIDYEIMMKQNQTFGFTPIMPSSPPPFPIPPQPPFPQPPFPQPPQIDQQQP